MVSPAVSINLFSIAWNHLSNPEPAVVLQSLSLIDVFWIKEMGI